MVVGFVPGPPGMNDGGGLSSGKAIGVKTIGLSSSLSLDWSEKSSGAASA